MSSFFRYSSIRLYHPRIYFIQPLILAIFGHFRPGPNFYIRKPTDRSGPPVLSAVDSTVHLHRVDDRKIRCAESRRGEQEEADGQDEEASLQHGAGGAERRRRRGRPVPLADAQIGRREQEERPQRRLAPSPAGPPHRVHVQAAALISVLSIRDIVNPFLIFSRKIPTHYSTINRCSQFNAIPFHLRCFFKSVSE